MKTPLSSLELSQNSPESWVADAAQVWQILMGRVLTGCLNRVLRIPSSE